MSRHRFVVAPLALLGLLCLTGCSTGNRPTTDTSQCQGDISVITLTQCPGGPYTVYVCARNFTVDDCHNGQPARICIWDGWVVVQAPDGTTTTTPNVAVTVMELRPPPASQPTSSSGVNAGGLALSGGVNLQFLALEGEMNWQPSKTKLPPKPILLAKLNDKSDLVYAPGTGAKMSGRNWFGGRAEARNMAVVSTEGLTYSFCDVSTANPPELSPKDPRNLDEVKKWALGIEEYIGRVRRDVEARNCTPHARN